jgi:hypothetical protein
MKYIFTGITITLLGLILFTETNLAKTTKKVFSNLFQLDASSNEKVKLEPTESFPFWKYLTTSKTWKTMEDDFDEQEGSEEEQENEELEEDA